MISDFGSSGRVEKDKEQSPISPAGGAVTTAIERNRVGQVGCLGSGDRPWCPLQSWYALFRGHTPSSPCFIHHQTTSGFLDRDP